MTDDYPKHGMHTTFVALTRLCDPLLIYRPLYLQCDINENLILETAKYMKSLGFLVSPFPNWLSLFDPSSRLLYISRMLGMTM